MHAGDITAALPKTLDFSPLSEFLVGTTGGDLRVKPNVFDSPLPKAFDLVAYDQRGLGRSAKPVIAYSMADYADDAAALLRDAQGSATRPGRRQREVRRAARSGGRLVGQ